MQTLSLGDTLALYINRTDLESLGLTQSERDLATLARRALAERGACGDAGITLEIYHGSAAAGELLLFCRPLAREVVAFPSLAAAIDAAKRLACTLYPTQYAAPTSDEPHEGRWSTHASTNPTSPAAGSSAAAGESGAAAATAAAATPRTTPPAPLAAAASHDAPSASLAPPRSMLHLTDTSVWLLTLRASPRRVRLLAAIAAEFGAPAEASDAYLAEHAELLIASNALALLAQL